MITELTKEQEEYCAVVRDEFINLALNTNTDVNKETAEKYIKLVYSLDEDCLNNIVVVFEADQLCNLCNYK
jgi:hypothetical protein